MRKTLATLAALSAALVVLSGCGSDDTPTTGTASPASATASSEPTADTSGEVPADGGAVRLADITDLSVVRTGEDSGVPGTDTVRVRFNITNLADYAVTFHVTIALFDATGAQATAVGVDTSEEGPTLPGKTLKVDAKYITGGKLPDGGFTAQVTEAQRQPA